MQPEKCAITPAIAYKITDNINFVSSLTIDSDYGVKGMIGADY